MTEYEDFIAGKSWRVLKENEVWRRLRDAVLLAQRSPIEFNLARVCFLERRLVKTMESGDDSREFFRSW